VSELLAVRTALRSLAAQSSPRLPPMAKLALDSCLACAAECRKHEGKHHQCKDCAEACKECADECRKVAA
jgi:Cys-rich four helix bundle protein (predicted Tat secretion target)